MQTATDIRHSTLRAPSIREILVPTDLSDAARTVALQAAQVAARFGSRLTLYHALEHPDHAEPHFAFGHPQQVMTGREREAHEQLADLARAVPVPCETIVERAGSASVALLERIDAARPDLTVMTTHRRRGLSHLLLGSVAEDVVQRTARPLLCVREGADVGRALSGCVVVETDFSPGADAALRLAGELAEHFGGELLVLCGGARRGQKPWQPYADAERALQALSHALPVRVMVDTAPSLAAVERVVRAEKAGLVVVPRERAHGRLSGVDAAEMVRRASCSVLVV